MAQNILIQNRLHQKGFRFRRLNFGLGLIRKIGATATMVQKTKIKSNLFTSSAVLVKVLYAYT